VPRLLLSLYVLACALSWGAAPVQAADAGPFHSLVGWWIGEGRLGFKDGKSETVKCRVTYVEGESVNDLAQTIRCASPSGKVEIKSTAVHRDGKVTGAWEERIYGLTGQIAGQMTERGFRVAVTGGEFSASMDIIVKGERQVIEIRFDTSTLLGMTLVLTRG
jgi:hypothetical protein